MKKNLRLGMVVVAASYVAAVIYSVTMLCKF
jgi:hypothetical protein